MLAARLYLGLNALLYAAFALWCLLRLERTASAIGYTALNASGRVEYATVYGGLQFGLALVYAAAAWNRNWAFAGLLLALLSYSAIVPVRWIGALSASGIDRITYFVAGLETLLWIGAVALAPRLVSRSP